MLEEAGFGWMRRGRLCKDIATDENQGLAKKREKLAAEKVPCQPQYRFRGLWRQF